MGGSLLPRSEDLTSILSRRGMTVIHSFWILILWMLPRRIFICNRILQQSLLARMTECPLESWILKVPRESNRETSTSAATKDDRNSQVEIGRESPRIP